MFEKVNKRNKTQKVRGVSVEEMTMEKVSLLF